MTNQITTVGAFTLSEPGWTLTGPADYLASAAYREVMNKIALGRSAVYNFGLTHGSPDVRTLVLVTIQTDYAGWLGARSLEVR